MRDVLKGIRVIELAGVLAGPSAGQLFAELGAEVVKVENARTSGDVTRTWRLPSETAPEASGGSANGHAGDDRTAYFSAANWGKRSVALDLSQEGGREALDLLLGGADVVLTAYKPGDAERLGIAGLGRQRPGLIVAELTGYGPEDPRAGYDAVVQAESGFMYLNGPPEAASGSQTAPDAGPTKMPVALMDLLAAHQIKEGVLAALFRRERTGEGAHVQVSLLGAALGALANQGTAWLQAGHEPRRMGSAHPQIAPYGTLYPTQTGPIVLAVGTDRQFAALCETLGLPLARDPRFATNPARVQHRDALEGPLAAATAGWEREALLDALHEQAVPAGAVRRVSEALAAPEADRIALQDGPLSGLRQAAFTLDGAESGDGLSPPPHYAAHTSAVLAACGASADALARWMASGAIVDRGP